MIVKLGNKILSTLHECGGCANNCAFENWDMFPEIECDDCGYGDSFYCTKSGANLDPEYHRIE